jgi:hypothetical protein
VAKRGQRAILEALDSQGAGVDLRPALALVGGQAVRLDEAELNAARRRALFLLAAGGDPQLGLDLDGRAVSALADELETAARRSELRDGLSALRGEIEALPFVGEALGALLADDDLAWRAFACALLAEELSSDA